MEDFSHHEFDLADFSLVYQPIYNVRSGQIEKIEALLRWTKSGNIEAFIRHFESTGQIKDLTLFVVETICADLITIYTVWANPVITINFSTIVLKDHFFVNQIIQTFVKHDIPPHMIEIEITESGGHITSEIIEGSHVFVKNGFRLVLDDFGKGSASLLAITKFNISTIKIDMSLTEQINKCAAIHPVISSIGHLSHKMGIDCIAEGVETREQEIFLDRLGIRCAQGYLYSKPINLKDLLVFIAMREDVENFVSGKILCTLGT